MDKVEKKLKLQQALALAEERKQRDFCIAMGVCPDCAVALESEQLVKRKFLWFTWHSYPNDFDPFIVKQCPQCGAKHLF
jgi:hypothetical protein